METLIKALESLVRALKNKTLSPTSQKIYDTAKSCLGTSLVPVGDDPDLGCAISVTVLLRDKCGIDIQKTAGTYTLIRELIASPFFKEVTEPQYGDVIIVATGTSSNPNTPIKHGHVGIVAKFGILSNNSINGIWSENYTLESWKQRYEMQGGYSSRYFRAL